MRFLVKGFVERDWFALVLVCIWKIILLVFTAQPIPTGDQYFFDGPVVHELNGGNYANPSLRSVLPISGTEVFAAYPPLYQALLWPWMKVWGTGPLSSMWFHLTLFAVYGAGLIAVFRALKVPALWANVGCLFLFGITFLDRPDTLAFACGTWSLFAWTRAAERGWANALGNRWSLLAASLAALTACASLHIGAMFFLWGALLALGTTWTRRSAFPFAPFAFSTFVLACLVGLVKFRYPHLWAGFQEHVGETPTLAGWTVASPVGQITGNLLRLLRSSPGLLLVTVLCVTFAVLHPRNAVASATTPRGMMLWGGLVIVGSMFIASFGLMMQGPVMWCVYVQPLLVTLFPVALTSARLGDGLYQKACAALALVAGVRALGMATWGVACSLDVDRAGATRLVRKACDEAPPGSSLIVSSAFLYEADRHKSLRPLHADWLVTHRPRLHGETNIVDCIVALRPAAIILTQFDLYRGCGAVLPILKSRPELAELQITNAARVAPPEAFASIQRVIQHVSWAPVIAALRWKEPPEPDRKTAAP